MSSCSLVESFELVAPWIGEVVALEPFSHVHLLHIPSSSSSMRLFGCVVMLLEGSLELLHLLLLFTWFVVLPALSTSELCVVVFNRGWI